MSKYFKAEITDNISLNTNFKILSLSPQSDIVVPLPGQFYMLHSNDTYDPLLKRPFSIFQHEDNSLKFLYRVRGKGTRCLSSLRGGDIIEVIGPLGNNYPEPDEDFIAVAGGVGIASLLPLLDKRKNTGYMFYGARSKDDLVMLREAGGISKEVFVATDDGSEGEKGLITNVLENFLDVSRITHHALRIYACGPNPMLKELSKITRERGMKCYVSLEEHMACGVGACLGCVVKTVSGYRRVCKEGPVFDSEELSW